MLLSLEVHADGNEGRGADPSVDAVRFIAYALMTDTGEGDPDNCVGCIYVDAKAAKVTDKPIGDKERLRFCSWLSQRTNFKMVTVDFVASEMQLFESFIARVRR